MDFLVARDFSALLGQQDWSCSPLAEFPGEQSCLHPLRTVGQVLTFTARFSIINAFDAKRYLAFLGQWGQDMAPTKRFPSERSYLSTPRMAGQGSAPTGGSPSCRSYLCPPVTVGRSWGLLVQFLVTASVCAFLICRDGAWCPPMDLKEAVSAHHWSPGWWWQPSALPRAPVGSVLLH